MSATDILIVDNNLSAAQELRQQLEELGYRVIDLAFSGEEAIEKTKKLCPQIVLMNMSLPGKFDGMQAGSHIRDAYNTPVIYTMDYGSQMAIRRAGTTGPFGYIFKPFNEKQILATIETAVIRHRLESKLQQSRQWLNTTLTSIGDGVIATDEQGLVRFINPVAMQLSGWNYAETMGKPLSEVFSLVEEHSHQPIDILERRSEPSQAPSKNGFEGLLISRGGVSIPVAANITSIDDGKGKAYGMVLIFRDVTQHREAMRDIKRQANRAEALMEMASRLNSQLELKTVLHTICEVTNQAIKASGTMVVLQSDHKGNFRNRGMVIQDSSSGAEGGLRIEIPKARFEALLSRQKPVVVIQDVPDQPDLTHFRILKRFDIRTLAVTALFRGNELIGALISVFAKQPVALPEGDIALLGGLADQACNAIENAELFEQVRAGRERQRKLAKSLVDIQESERRHIARELHDHLGQLLTGLQFMLEPTKSRATGKQRTNLVEIQNTVADIIEQVREMSLNLRPGMLDDLGLIPTLQWHFERFTRQTGIRINFQSDEVPSRFPAEIETTAYRIIQEALTNVARHAGVKFVFVGLAVQQDILWVEVVDQGRGFDASAVLEKPSAGLGGMRERAELAGGYVLVRSILEQGTQVIAALPIHENRLERRRNVRKSSFD
jgi:PAS domain S-box-containing protein